MNKYTQTFQPKREVKNIIALKGGWYSFGQIPQGYIRIDGLCCKDDKNALKQAKKISKQYDYVIVR